MAVSAMECWLLPLSQTSIRFVGHIGYHDYEGPAIDKGSASASSTISGRMTRW
jgi:hypothetical protein